MKCVNYLTLGLSAVNGKLRFFFFIANFIFKILYISDCKDHFNDAV